MQFFVKNKAFSKRFVLSEIWDVGINVFFVKGGKFPNGHVSGNKALRNKGISCAQSQDREAQSKPRFSFSDVERTLNDSMN